MVGTFKRHFKVSFFVVVWNLYWKENRLLTEKEENQILRTDKEVLPKNGAVIAGTYEGKKDKKEKEEETVKKVVLITQPQMP